MKKRNLKVMSMVMTAIMSVSFFITSKGQIVKAYDSRANNDLKKVLIEKLESELKKGDKFENVETLEKDNENDTLNETGNPEEIVRVIVELRDLPATLQLEDGIQPSENMINQVKEAQKPIQEKAKEITGEEINHTYGNLINGFSMEMKRKDIEKVKAIEGVIDVQEVNIYYPDMNSAKEFTQALEVWNDYGYKGEGMVVSIIDTGIDPSHKDMRLSDSDTVALTSDNVNVGEGKYYSEKVPYGYNFADKNDEILDVAGSMHGMHVAGIVGANATDEEVENNTGIQGVAPEAQLLAMKVFTNNPEVSGAYADDIIAAIEASAELGADVINMSLGANCGYRNAEDPEQVAIKNATDDGVICVVSAGNSTTSLDPYIVEGVSDTGIVGSPGIAQDALQVASSENSIITLPAVEADINGETKLMAYTECDVDPLDKFNVDEELELVDCGFGNVSDFEGVDVKGKVAFISRGDITFVDKQINAQAAGAKAVVIYNNVANSAHINMASDASIKIPVIFITKEDANLLKEGPLSNATLSFKGEVTTAVNPASAQMSSFTSWGPTPDLQFTPQITAPGGNIYSTLNNNKYGSMSGTSMAAPHVAGATALIIQGLKDNGIDLEGRELVEFVKKSIINTANTLYEKNAFGEEVPYSPRRQGAGLIQAKDAIDNRVLVTGEDDEATVALKEIGDTTNFKLTLTNYSDKEEKYTVQALSDVLTAFTPSMIGREVLSGYVAFDTVLEGATVDFDKESVTVPANGQAEVNVTLNIPADIVSNNFVEGFIKFIAEDEETPSLVVPYVGYYGEWDAEAIIDGTVWGEDTIISPSFGATKVLGDYNYLGFEGSTGNGVVINPDKIAISPNDDELGDGFYPALYFLRNAKEIAVDLLDESGNVVAKNVAGGNEYRKKVFSGTNGSSASIYSDIAWDGKVYNKSTGKDEVVAEGQYYLNYKAKVDGDNCEYQDFVMPVKVDLTPIDVNLVSSTTTEDSTYNLELDFGGELESGMLGQFVIAVNGEALSDEVINQAVVDGDKLSLDIALQNDAVNTVEVLTIDNAYNISEDEFSIVVGNVESEVKIVDFPDSGYVDNDELLIKGVYSGSVDKILINGEEPDTMENGTFTKLVKLEEGANTVKLYATDITGKVIANYGHKVFLDTIAPNLILFEPNVNEEGVVLTANNTLKIKGSISDNSEAYSLYLNGEKKLTVEQSGGDENSNYKEFEYELPVENDDIVTLKAIDIVGHETIKQFKVEINTEIPEINVTGVENGKVYNTNILPNITATGEGTTIETTLNGEIYNGKEITEEGNYLLDIKAIGVNGIENKLTLQFEIDKTNPIILIEGVEEGKAYNEDVLPTIVFEDNTNNTVTLNGEVYDGIAITEEGSYVLEATSSDKAGNVTTSKVNFVIDKTSPVIIVEGIVDGMKYDKEVKAIVTVDEDADTVITLNDKVYNGEVIKENGQYVLKVIAKDKAGNTTEVSISFTIELPKTDTENPTPTPTPGGNGSGSGNGSNTTNDDNTDKKKPTQTIVDGKGNKLANTGGTNVVYPIAIGVVLVIGGAAVVLKKKKSDN